MEGYNWQFNFHAISTFCDLIIINIDNSVNRGSYSESFSSYQFYLLEIIFLGPQPVLLNLFYLLVLLKCCFKYTFVITPHKILPPRIYTTCTICIFVLCIVKEQHFFSPPKNEFSPISPAPIENIDSRYSP